MVDVEFKFVKEGFEDLVVVKAVHEKGQLHAFFPNRLWFNNQFEVIIQDSDGLPVEGVEVFVNGISQGDTDTNGKIKLILQKN